MSVVRSVWKVFDDYIHEGEPLLRQWPLLSDIRTPILTATLYVLFVKVIGPAFMKNRKPYNLRTMMPPYNLALVIFYIYFIIKGFTFLPKLGKYCFCGPLKITKSPVIFEIFTLGWRLYAIKYVELLDTIFLVLSKKFKMITTLHVLHHALVPLLGFVGFRSETSAYLSVFMMLNSFIHVIMYSYYGIAALGPKYQKYLWWKKYLTKLQIAQFAFMAMYITVMWYLGCATSKVTVYICLVTVFTFFILFSRYYKNMFIDQPKKQLHRNQTPKLPNVSISNNCLLSEKKKE